MNTKVHVKTGDTVMILSGKDRGKKGKVMQVSPKAVSYTHLDKIRENHGRPAPGLDDLLLAGLVHSLDPFQQHGLYKGSLLQASAHRVFAPFPCGLLTVSPLYDKLIAAVLLLAGLITQGRLAPGLSLIHI